MLEVDALVVQAARAKLVDRYAKRLKAIARIADRALRRSTAMRPKDLGALLRIRERSRSDQRSNPHR